MAVVVTLAVDGRKPANWHQRLARKTQDELNARQFGGYNFSEGVRNVSS
jgi:hypothetical protein